MCNSSCKFRARVYVCFTERDRWTWSLTQRETIDRDVWEQSAGWGDILNVRARKWPKSGENYVMRKRVTTCCMLLTKYVNPLRRRHSLVGYCYLRSNTIPSVRSSHNDGQFRNWTVDYPDTKQEIWPINCEIRRSKHTKSRNFWLRLNLRVPKSVSLKYC